MSLEKTLQEIRNSTYELCGTTDALQVYAAPAQAGDTVTLIKDLNVNGANFMAKRGTAAGNISLSSDNAEHFEDRLNGQQNVILTQFVKKPN